MPICSPWRPATATRTLDVPRREFYNPNGDWNTNANWSGNNTPDNADDTFVRNNATATLSAFGAAGNLTVDEGALVSTQTNTLFVQNTTTVGGTAGPISQITINTDGELDSDVLNINDDGRVVLVGTTSLLQSENINIANGGELRGRGTVDHQQRSVWRIHEQRLDSRHEQRRARLHVDEQSGARIWTARSKRSTATSVSKPA